MHALADYTPTHWFVADAHSTGSASPSFFTSTLFAFREPKASISYATTIMDQSKVENDQTRLALEIFG